VNRSEALRAFHGFWQGLGCKGDAEPVIVDLIGRYGGPRRHYHTLEHIRHGLRRIEDMRRELHSDYPGVWWDAMRWAMWFHDAVLEGADSDERKSAEFACAVASDTGCPGWFREIVAACILASAHDGSAETLEQKLFVDADIAILGANEVDFDAYEQLIRQEWAHIPEPEFREGRRRILLKFADRPYIFSSEYGRARWEARARLNLDCSLAKLATPSTAQLGEGR